VQRLHSQCIQAYCENYPESDMGNARQRSIRCITSFVSTWKTVPQCKVADADNYDDWPDSKKVLVDMDVVKGRDAHAYRHTKRGCEKIELVPHEQQDSSETGVGFQPPWAFSDPSRTFATSAYPQVREHAKWNQSLQASIDPQRHLACLRTGEGSRGMASTRVP